MTSLGDDQLTIGGERWSLGRLIGKGGFASVYEAVASGSGVQAAVKVVERERAMSRSILPLVLSTQKRRCPLTTPFAANLFL